MGFVRNPIDPPGTFSTTSLLMASWLCYSQYDSLNYLRYDPKTRLHWFHDPESLIQFIVEGYHALDPRVELHRFEKVRARLLREKNRADADYRAGGSHV